MPPWWSAGSTIFFQTPLPGQLKGMRKLTKGPEPQVLVDNATVWTAELLATLKGSPPYKAIQGRYRQTEIRDALRAETHRKCAYCESEIEAAGYPHIEHIQPKAVRDDLTFSWPNLTLGCTKCNINKGDDQPTAANFVHPYDDDPTGRFTFVGPLMKATPGDIPARNMINWLDLNRGALIISRSEIVDKVLHIYEEAIQLPLEARDEFVRLSLRPLTSAEARHSRVAQCAAALFSEEYSAALTEDNAIA
jgi:uncharacterized protein (TIGR02646 family)